MLPLPLIPTTLVGSYPQPDWLIDRERLLEPPAAARARAWSCGGCRSRTSRQRRTTRPCWRSATWSAPASTSSRDGEIRRESYSNRFATALDGIDLDNPAMVPGRTGQRERRAARGRADPPPRPVEVDDLRFLRANTDRRSRSRCPGRSR